MICRRSRVYLLRRGRSAGYHLEIMKKDMKFVVFQEGKWFIAQCLDVDVASQGLTEDEAVENLRDALKLHYTPPTATVSPQVQTLEFEVAG